MNEITSSELRKPSKPLGQTWHATPILRWYVYSDGERILQQKWKNVNGEATQWVEIHSEYELNKK